MRIARIANCGECPWRRSDIPQSYCRAVGRDNDFMTFRLLPRRLPSEPPDWCPLEKEGACPTAS